MCFIIWIYHILYISSPIQEHFVDFQVFLIVKSVTILVCDFIFSCSFPPQEAWALTCGRSFPVEGHGQSLWGLQNWNCASLLFPWFGLCGPGSWGQVWDPRSLPWAKARLLVEFAAGRRAVRCPLLKVRLLPAPRCDQRPGPEEACLLRCAAELTGSSLISLTFKGIQRILKEGAPGKKFWVYPEEG